MKTKHSDGPVGGMAQSEDARMSSTDEQIYGHEEPAVELKSEHSVVLRTLKAANIASRRVVSNQEIVRALADSEVTQIKGAYQQNIGTVIGKILTLLQARRLVFSPGKIGSNRYYGTTAVFPSGVAGLPDKQTQRGRVLLLVHSAVAHFGRAVRVGDVLAYAARETKALGLDAATIAHDVLSLAQTDDLRVVGVVRGEERGNNLYLPSGLETEHYLPKGSLTWLEEVAQAFNEVWAEHLKNAEAEGRLPRPVSTGEIRARWAASPNAHPKAYERQPVVNAMGMLAQKSRKQPPLIRKIRRRGEKAILWAPVDISDEQLDIGDAYASDAERIGIAVQRAAEQLGRPVTVRDVADEVELDPTLRPASSVSLFKLLLDASKENVAVGKGKRKPRVVRRVYRVGAVDNVAYYYHRVEGLDEARAYLELQRVESRWLAMQPEERLQQIKDCLAPSLAIGGARLILVEAQSLCQTLNDLLTGQIDSTTRREAEDLLEQVKEVASEAHQRITYYNDETLHELPEDISTDTSGWTAEEVFSILHPLHPKLKNGRDHNDLNGLLWKAIRRFPNPHYKHRFSKEPRGASEFLFDRTHTLIYAAKRWGGYECSFQAKTAGGELGWLRDVRYVFPALFARDVRVRLSGIACLAFLRSAEGNNYLQQIATDDLEPGARQSALWAYGFADGKGVQELLRERVSNDASAFVRTFAKDAMSLSEKGWWAL